MLPGSIYIVDGQFITNISSVDYSFHANPRFATRTHKHLVLLYWRFVLLPTRVEFLSPLARFLQVELPAELARVPTSNLKKKIGGRSKDFALVTTGSSPAYASYNTLL